MKKNKKYFSMIFFLVLVLLISSCSFNKEETNDQSTEVVDTRSLINNILEVEGNEDLEKVSENEEIKKEDKKEESQDESLDIETSRKRDNKNKKSNKKEEELDKENTKTVRIKAFGDIMAHMGQINYAKYKGYGEYDFSDQFEYIKDFVEDADISIGNFEATTNPDLDYMGFPKFNVPSNYLVDIKNAGFDIVTTANNHSLDTGEDGVQTTIDAIEFAGLDHVGTQFDSEEKILYQFVGDVKIAFLSYTYGANDLENTIENHDVTEILNFLDEEKIKEDIKEAKENKADFVVVYPHWGIEYQTSPSEDQIHLGRKMIDWGADIVIGNHPHVVQPAEYYQAKDGRLGFIAYALGNMISLQSLETLEDIRTEQSVAYEIELSKDVKNKKTEIKEVTAYPLWVGTTYNEFGGKTQTYIADDFLDDGKYSDLVDEYQKNRIQEAKTMVSETITSEVE